MQVDSTALTAFEINGAGSRKAEVLGNQDVLRKRARAVDVVQYVRGESCRREAVQLRNGSQVLSDVSGGVRLASSSMGREPSSSTEQPNRAVGGLLNKRGRGRCCDTVGGRERELQGLEAATA